MPVPKGFRTHKKLMTRAKRKRVCDRRSYGITPERKGYRTLVCCPRGRLNEKTGKCRTGTKAVEVFKRK